MEIRPLDAADDPRMTAFHAAYDEAHRSGLEHATPWLLEEMRTEFRRVSVGSRLLPFGGYVDDDLVTTGVLQLSLRDNLDVAEVDVATPPAHRRRGYGAAMLDHLVEVAREQERHRLLSMASWGWEAPVEGTGTTNADFLRGQGFSLSLVDVKRVLSLPVDDGLLTRLGDEAAAHHRDYRLRSWVGAVPDDVVDSYGALVGQLVVEAPSGEDHDWEAEVFDAARIRDDEQALAAMSRTKYTTVATTTDGEVVAFTDIAASSVDTENAYQWGTLVHPRHRGHRLGLATKVANLLALQHDDPARRQVYTWNAEVNRPMVTVNEQLGFRPVGRSGEFVRNL